MDEKYLENTTSKSQEEKGSILTKLRQRLQKVIFSDVVLPQEIQTILRFIEESLRESSNICILIPSVREMAIVINNGESLVTISSGILRFRHKTTFVEESLPQDQCFYIMDIISQKAQEKCDQINESIVDSFKEMIL